MSTRRDTLDDTGNAQRIWNGKTAEEFTLKDELLFAIDTDLALHGRILDDTLAAIKAAGYQYENEVLMELDDVNLTMTLARSEHETDIGTASYILDLIKDLEAAESSKNTFQNIKKDLEQEINNAGPFIKLFKRDDLKMLDQNIKSYDEDIREYESKIKDITRKINELGYDASDIKKIRDFQAGYIPDPENYHPWIKLLSKTEKDSLLVEVITDRYESYSSLMDLTNYIDSFKTDAEKLDFVHGFQPDFNAEGKQTDAYKIGALFYDAGFNYSIDLEKVLKDYAPQYRHDLKFVSLIKEYSMEAAILDNIYDSFEAIPGGLDEGEHFTHISKQMKSNDIANEFEGKLDGLYEEIRSYEFYGKIDFLGLDRHRNTIVGETLYYDNYKDYKKEVDESRNCGRPISASSISKEEYEARNKVSFKQKSVEPKRPKRLEEFRNRGQNTNSMEMTI